MRLLTRSDFDGLACGVLLKEQGVIDSHKFVHPKDVQDGLVEVSANDVLVNLPFVKGCGLWFDHHASEQERLQLRPDQFEGSVGEAPSTARLIYDYYGGAAKFGHLEPMMAAVDQSDAAQFTIDEVLNPTGWVLLSFIMDPRTGLGRYRHYRISNYQLMEELMEHCRHLSIEQILDLPDVQERVTQYFAQDKLFRAMLNENTRTDGNVIITDLRGAETIYSGNRFVVYSLYPKQNISIWVIDGKDKQNCVFAVGHSIVNRTSQTNVGSLMLKYGGGGHPQVGTCQVDYEQADEVLDALITQMKQDG